MAAKKIGIDVLGAVLLLVGAVWTLQGMNVLLGSFMSGQTTWLAIGIVVALAGLTLVVWNHRRA